MTYAEAIQFLHGLQVFGANFGLETPRKLAALAGNPHERLRFIHVAGTNGKGSTSAMLESIYRTAGLRVGLFTSPHLVSFRERIQVNRQHISQPDVARLADEMGKQGSEFRLQAGGERANAGTPNPDAHPTFFEFVTVLALKYFAEQKCDLVIWETGLGGRLDATNIVTPLASVITNIALDHQQWLGDTLEKIATEKAGIIKPGVPVVTAVAASEALRVIARTARKMGSPLVEVEPVGRLFGTGKSPVLPLLGEHQRLNAALALATVEVLQNHFPVSVALIHAGLAQVNWPGRLQLITQPGRRRILLDGAHNVAGASVLRVALEKDFTETERTFILGILGDKDWRMMLEILAPLAARILLVPVNNPRTTPPAEMARFCQKVNPALETEVCDSLPAALKQTWNEAFVVIAGSLYLVGEALELLDPAWTQAAGERGLNEWSTVAIHSAR